MCAVHQPSNPQYSGVLSNRVSTDERGENAKKLLFEFWSSPSKLFTLGGKVGCSSLASTIESSLLFTVSNWWPRIFSSLAGHSHAGRLQNALLL